MAITLKQQIDPAVLEMEEWKEEEEEQSTIEGTYIEVYYYR